MKIDTNHLGTNPTSLVPFVPIPLDFSNNPMPFDILPGAVCKIDGHEVTYAGALGGGFLNFIQMPHGNTFQYHDLLSNVARLPDASLLTSMYEEGNFAVLSKGPHAPASARLLPEYDHEEISDHDPKARYRRFVVTQLIELGAKCSDPDIKWKLNDIWSDEVQATWGDKPVPSSARRWLSKATKLDHIRLVDMMSMSGQVARRPSARRMDPTLRDFVAEGARYYFTARGLTEADAAAKINDLRKTENKRRVDEGGFQIPLPIPSRSTVRRAIKAIQCRDTLTEKYGKEWVKRRYKTSGKGLHTTAMLQIALIDDKLFDGVFVLDAERRLPVGRPWLCVMVDVHTRCILGWHIGYDSPTLHSAVETFKNGCRPKIVRPDRRARYPVLASIWGQPSELLADNGSNYVSPGLQDGLADIGTTLRLAAVRTPQHKAILERIFSTLDTFLAKKLPGATLDPMLARELGLDSATEAFLTLAELNELIEEFVYVYHIVIHSGIEMQPALAWDISRRTTPIRLLKDVERLDQLLGEPYRRRLTRNGVTVQGLWWRDERVCGVLADDIAAYEPAADKITGTFSATVKVKINPGNLARAQVWNPRRKRYVTLLSATPRYCEGLTMYQHKQICAWAKRNALAFNTEEERLEARHGLNERIKALAPQVAVRERRAMARMLGSSFVQSEQNLPAIVDIAERHDGMGDVITVLDAASERQDGGALFNRPAPELAKQNVESPLDPAIEDARDPTNDDEDYDDPENLWDDEDEAGLEARS